MEKTIKYVYFDPQPHLPNALKTVFVTVRVSVPVGHTDKWYAHRIITHLEKTWPTDDKGKFIVTRTPPFNDLRERVAFLNTVDEANPEFVGHIQIDGIECVSRGGLLFLVNFIPEPYPSLT